MPAKVKIIKSKYIIPILGILIVMIGMLPYFILKGNCSVSVREELDGEIICYILGSKYLFTGNNFYPEVLGGVYKQSLMPPSFITLLLFGMFSPLWAYIVNRLLLMLVAFVSMYLWLNCITKNRYIALIVGVYFAFLPYYSMYGITVAGVPLVFYAFHSILHSNDKRILPIIVDYILIAIYGFGSSLVLCGFSVVGVICLWLVLLLLKKDKYSFYKRKMFFLGIALLCIVYLIQNHDLIIQIFYSTNSFVSHKSEYILNSAPFFTYVRDMIINGLVAVPSLHRYIFIESVLCMIVIPIYTKFFKKRLDDWPKKNLDMLIMLVVSAIVIAVISGVRKLPVVAEYLNMRSGAMKSFQFDRIYWLYPFIWYTALGLIGALLVEVYKEHRIGLLIYILFLLPSGILILKESAFKENAMEFFRDNSTALTWDAYFCEKEFSEVADYIESETSLVQSEYRVGSLGIEPAVSLRSGFYTIDGYSNNYDVSYKHRFREVISKELDKNPYNKEYFDSWGNRCYLYSSEYYGNPLLTKYEHPYFENLELNTAALKELGCRYLLSAGMIEGAEDRGYKLCKVFDSPEYTYVIYLYEIV